MTDEAVERQRATARRLRQFLAVSMLTFACLITGACGGVSRNKHHVSTTPRTVGGSPPTAPETFPGRPNIVFVLMDDLSADLVRYMPHVLATERKRLTFTNYFVSDSLCCPSRASIFTPERGGRRVTDKVENGSAGVSRAHRVTRGLLVSV